MSSDDKQPSIELLTAFGLTEEEWQAVMGERNYLQARRDADTKMAGMAEILMTRVDEINRILAPVGLRYDVRSVFAE